MNHRYISPISFPVTIGGSVGYDTNGVWNPDVIEFDIKAMRKLRETDEIALAYIANNSGDIKLIGDIYLWFKE